MYVKYKIQLHFRETNVLNCCQHRLWLVSRQPPFDLLDQKLSHCTQHPDQLDECQISALEWLALWEWQPTSNRRNKKNHLWLIDQYVIYCFVSRTSLKTTDAAYTHTWMFLKHIYFPIIISYCFPCYYLWC